MNEADTGLVRSLTNALKVIEVISSHQPIGVSELSREVALPKSTVQRALATFQQAGWIRVAPGSDQTRWELTSRMLVLALRARGEASLRDIAEPAMSELRERTNETVHLVALDGDTGLVIHRVDSSHTVRAVVELGTRVPLHVSSSGQAILAYRPPEQIKSILAGDLVAFTPRTVTDAVELGERLEVIRSRGFAVNVGEYRNEVASISCPILDVDGWAMAAISISIPVSRFSDTLAESYGLLAKSIVEELGPVSPRFR